MMPLLNLCFNAELSALVHHRLSAPVHSTLLISPGEKDDAKSVPEQAVNLRGKKRLTSEIPTSN